MTITEQKAFLRSYTGQAQAPADFAQRWQETAAALHRMHAARGGADDPGRDAAPVKGDSQPLIHAAGVAERDGRTAYRGVLLMYHDLNRGVRGWHHMTRFLALGFGVVALEAEPFREDWKVQPAQAAFRQRYLDALAVAKAALALPWVDTGRVYTFGEGFGGGLALLAASLCPAVSRCAALNPLPGDFAGLGLPGYDELDAANFAPLCRAEVLLGTCLMDEYAPPKGQAAIYNRLTCPKQWKLYPKYVHERVNFFENQMLCFFKDGIPEA